MQLRSAALTDIGKVRRQNEDRLLRDETIGLFGVADGVGGLPGGAEASQCAADMVSKLVREGGETPDLTQIAVEANHAVAQLGMKLSPHFGIGTTLTFGLFRGRELNLAHVGDSRCYCLRGGALECLTMDHSVENEARARRARGELIWVNEQHRNALTRCIGQNTPLEVDLLTRQLEAGDRYIFCSDGVTRLITEDELGAELARDATPGAILKGIIDRANARGGLDNSTGVLIFIDKVP